MEKNNTYYLEDIIKFYRENPTSQDKFVYGNDVITYEDGHIMYTDCEYNPNLLRPIELFSCNLNVEWRRIKAEDMNNFVLDYSVKIDMDKNLINITGISSNGHNFDFIVKKDERGYVNFIGKTPLDYYQNKKFKGGEFKYFEKQLSGYRYILGDVHTYR